MKRAVAIALLLLISISFHCKRAEGVAQDPLAREAEEAFVAYLRIDTSNPPGNETAGAAFLRDLFAKEGIAAQLVGDDPKRQGVYAKLDSPATDDALLLLNHIDVVPADAGAWTQPPFGGVRASGYIWGRGALDTKGLAIAQAYSLIDLKRRNATLKRDLIFLAVPDEELGGLHGTAQLLEKRPDLFSGVRYVLNEGGSNETAVDKVLFWGIEVQQKVPLWLRVTATGNGGHGAMPPDDGGPTAKLVRALAAIDALEPPYRLEESVARAAAYQARVRKDGRGARLRLFREPLDIPAITREFPPGYRTLIRDTIAITHIEAGTSVNMIPAKASADIDIRLLPDTKPAAMIEQVKNAAGKHANVEVILAGEPTPESPASGEVFETIARVFQSHAPGSIAAPVVGAGTTDSRYFRARGITAYGIMPFKVNYYDADSVHGGDERMRGRFFGEGVRLMRELSRELCQKK